MNSMFDLVRSGLYGLCVGDAVGVPAEFRSRESLQCNPVTDMGAGGAHGQPKGTWSDDSSMTLCLVHSIARNESVCMRDIMDCFLGWYKEGLYSPTGECFDIGGGTAQALLRYREGVTPELCGGDSIHSNGNGSLMRILPLAYVLYRPYGADLTKSEKAMELIHKVSGLTHRHPLAQSACGIYVNIATRLLDRMELSEAVREGVLDSLVWYRKKENFKNVQEKWERLSDIHAFEHLKENKIKSGGYVVETLEAVIWCLLNTKDYKSCILKAVNLGNDTDTIAAIAGGLAGLAYGYENIPAEWIEDLQGKRLIEDCCAGLAEYMKKKRENQEI